MPRASQEQDECPDRQPVHCEWNETAGGDEADEGLEHQQRADERHDHADRKHRQVRCAQQVTALVEIETGCREHHGHREEEGELCRRLPRAAECVCPHDRGAAARDAWIERQDLRQPHPECRRQRQFLRTLDAGLRGKLLDQENAERAQDEAPRDGVALEQVRLDEIARRKADDRGWQEPARRLRMNLRLAGCGRGRAPHSGKARDTSTRPRGSPELDDHLERLPGLRGAPSNSPARIRCPVDDTGMNSVTPSTTPGYLPQRDR
jgi:hypothetical protein